MTLADQILQRWGQYGDWQAADQNQAADLARLFEANGITDLGQLQFAPRAFEMAPNTWETPSGMLSDGGAKGTAFDVTYGGQPVSFLGDVNRDGSLSAKPGGAEFGVDRGSLRGNGDLLGWSARGGGNTSFVLRQDPNTGQTVVVPTWGSSSGETYDDVRGIASILALAGGAYYAPTSAAAQGALQGHGMATGAAMLGDGDVDSISKAGLAGAATGAIGGGIKAYGAEQGWSPATTRAVSGGVNTAMRGGDGRDILTGAATGYLSGNGQSMANNFMPGGDMKTESGFFDQGGAGADGGGAMDFSGSFDPSLYDFGGYDFGGGWSNNVFGDTFGNTGANFGGAYDQSIYNFGQTFDNTGTELTYPGGSNGYDWSKLGGNALKWLTTGSGKDGTGVPPWAALLGATMGAMDSKDKQQTSSREPWAPMQPYLMGLAEDGRGLYNQYKAQPFSPAQQTAYGNVGGLLDVLNQNAGGLLQGMQANATGANQFVRGKPRALTGSAPIDGVAFAPGLLGNFGTRRG